MIKNNIMNNKFFIGIISFISILILNVDSFAQTVKKDEHSDTYVYMILAALLFTLAVLFASIMIFESKERAPKIEKEKVTLASAPIIEDHIYDGIQELDNPAPAWFQFLFYITIVFGIIYMLNFHILGKNNSSTDEYMQEMTFARQQKDELIRTGALINESNVTLLTDKADIDKGKEIFAANCVSCHAPDGGGGVGPNLTDAYWIHGGGIKNVFTTVKNGVPAKGMIAWQTQLNPKAMNQVASYVLTLQGTKPANPKAPEGNIYVDSTATPKDSLKK